MSIKDALRVIALEQEVAELRANVSAVKDMRVGLQARFEAHLADPPAAAVGVGGIDI
jgi:hypothetical protein